ncbi:antiterminator Q family protein [Escherichia coli]
MRDIQMVLERWGAWAANKTDYRILKNYAKTLTGAGV